jgi:putative MATE family efflux protein
MTATAPTEETETASRPPTIQKPKEHIPRMVLFLALPVVAEQLLHSLVGLTDFWVASHLVPSTDPNAAAINNAAGAAVGSVQYVLWLIGMLAGMIGTGATALIARAIGARDRRTANASCGQAISLALMVGGTMIPAMYFGAHQFAVFSELHGDSLGLLVQYLQILCFVMPFTLLMFSAGACLRGSGDTISPAIAMITVDIVNLFLTTGLGFGMFGLPHLGFKGIAIGTTIAYAVGGLILVTILFVRRGFMRLYLHRMIPHWPPLKRILRIGLPSGSESAMQWMANFLVLGSVNHLGEAAGTAHAAAIRLESFSFLTGMGFATAAATLVGQSLGMKDPRRARHCAYVAYAMGGGVMTFMGVLFILFGHQLAWLMSKDPAVIELTAGCIRTTGFIQAGFAAAMIFGFAMRGAGDTMHVMIINLASIFLLRLAGVIIVVRVMGLGLGAIWFVLCGELMVRGLLMFLRFRFGRWDAVKV